MDDAVALLSVAVAGIVGIGGLIATVWQANRSSKDSERHAREQRDYTEKQTREWFRGERGADAANSLRQLMFQLRDLYEQGAEEVGDQNYALSQKIEAEVMLLPSEELRERLDGLSRALWFVGVVSDEFGDEPFQVCYVLAGAGLQLIGSYLRDDELPPTESSFELRRLDAYAKYATDFYEKMARRLEET